MRTPNPTLLLLALLASCGGYEHDIDRSVLRGTVTLAPEALEEGEAEAGANDDATLATDLGYFSYRTYQITGSCLEFDNFSGTPNGDVDWYAFSPQVDGALAVTLDFSAEDGIYFYVGVFDLDTLNEVGEPTELVGTVPIDSGGTYTFEADVVAGGNYAVVVGGTRNQNDADPSYTLTLWPFDPTGSDVLVGAYAEQDPFERSYPLGGTSVSAFDWDDATMSWSGDFEILYIRSLTTTYTDPATGEGRDDQVEEAINSVWLHAGTYGSLNSAILAGVSFSTTSVEVTLNTDDAETDLHEGIQLSIDETQPIQVGWVFTETEPNDVELDTSTFTLVGDLSVANALPTASGLGFVDFASGSLTYDVDDPLWDTDNDVLALSASELSTAILTLDWSDPLADIDMIIFDSTGNWLSYSTASSAKPETLTLSDEGIYFGPDETIYLQILGYYGAAGEQPWSLSIEYTTP